MHLDFPPGVGQHQEQGHASWGGGGGDPAFSRSTFPPQCRCFGGMEEVAACLQPRSGFEGRRNILLNCTIQPWPVPAPISCPGGGPEGAGNGQGCKLSFYFM